MSKQKLFLLIIGIVSVVLLLFDNPNPTTIKNFNLPFTRKTTKQKDFTFNPSKLDINLGFTQIQRDIGYKLGLDLQGGTKLIYLVDMAKIKAAERDAAFESARSVIERRVNFFGVTEPTIQTLKVGNDYRIIVELPGVTDVTQAVDLIGRTAQLTFWEEGKIASSTPNLPLGIAQIYPSGTNLTKLTGKDLTSAKVVFDTQTGKPQVQLNFSSEGTRLFAEITKRNVGKQVAIVLDNVVIQNPTVNEPILNGNAVISGGFTPEIAKSVAIQLNAGALPAPLKLIGQSTVGATLGVSSLQKSIFAGAIGLFSVVIFMVYLYRKEGLLASIALLMYTIITLFLFKIIPITLTLAGIAGFVLSIGMAVDANILIFERMREELRAGKPRDIAVRLGFSRAWSSIRDSNISSLLTSAILFYFGSGIIRGFAVTLFIGILVSMFSAITITRNLLRVFDSSVRSK